MKTTLQIELVVESGQFFTATAKVTSDIREGFNVTMGGGPLNGLVAEPQNSRSEATAIGYALTELAMLVRKAER